MAMKDYHVYRKHLDRMGGRKPHIFYSRMRSRWLVHCTNGKAFSNGTFGRAVDYVFKRNRAEGNLP